MFAAEWFRDYHEFHLHRNPTDHSQQLRLWDLDRGSSVLSREQSVELYRQAARILTLHYNWNSFEQIYPWHHAAGDFVAKKASGQMDLRLITVRDYRPVVSLRTEKREGKLLALIFFFLHLTIQMRLDRFDGVGEVGWADQFCIRAICTGFFDGLELGGKKTRKGIPAVTEILDLLRSFTKEEWLHFLGECLQTYTSSQDELYLIQQYGTAHLDGVQQALATLE
jgi:hypothetical protein